MENKEKITVSGGEIDKEVLDIMSQEDVLKAINDDVQMRRMELNLFCEFLSEIKAVKSEFEQFAQMVSICSSNKIADFFKTLKSNVEDENARIELQEKMKESHKKSKKRKKNAVKA